MLVCTSICSNYFPKAMALAQSLKSTNPGVYFIVCLVEREVPDPIKGFEYFDEIVLAKDLGFPEFDRVIFSHSIVEASTAVKGQLIRYLIDNYPDENKFVYLDPDIMVFSRLKELDELLDSNDIILTPHLTIPECKETRIDEISAVMDNELCALRHGVYNLGFLSVNRSAVSSQFVDWWASRLSMFCYDDIPNGIFTDQKWIDLAPGFFPVHILRHPGYNVAPWNLSMRKMSFNREEGVYLVNDEPLRFFHFSGWDSGANEAMVRKYVADLDNPVYELRRGYNKITEQCDNETYEKIPWSYGYFHSGEKISKESRIIYRTIKNLLDVDISPFDKSNNFFKHNPTIVAKSIDHKLKRKIKKLVKSTIYKNKYAKKLIDDLRFRNG